MIARTDEIRLRLLKEGRDPYVTIAELEDEVERLRDAINRALSLTSTYDFEHHGVVKHLIGNKQARRVLEEAAA